MASCGARGRSLVVKTLSHDSKFSVSIPMFTGVRIVNRTFMLSGEVAARILDEKCHFSVMRSFDA